MRSCQWKRHFDLFWLPLLFRLPTCFCCPTSPYKNQPTQTKWTKNKEEKQRQIKASVYNWRHGGNQEHCIENLAEHKSGISAAYNMNFKLGTEHCKYRINKTRNFPQLDQNLCGSAKCVRKMSKCMCVCAGRPLICQRYELKRKMPTFISYYINLGQERTRRRV